MGKYAHGSREGQERGRKRGVKLTVARLPGSTVTRSNREVVKPYRGRKPDRYKLAMEKRRDVARTA